jgi:hypothetical protein
MGFFPKIFTQRHKGTKITKEEKRAKRGVVNYPSFVLQRKLTYKSLSPLPFFVLFVLFVLFVSLCEILAKKSLFVPFV